MTVMGPYRGGLPNAVASPHARPKTSSGNPSKVSTSRTKFGAGGPLGSRRKVHAHPLGFRDRGPRWEGNVLVSRCIDCGALKGLYESERLGEPRLQIINSPHPHISAVLSRRVEPSYP